MELHSHVCLSVCGTVGVWKSTGCSGWGAVVMGAGVANYSKGISQTLGNQTPNPLCVTTHTHTCLWRFSVTTHTHANTHHMYRLTPFTLSTETVHYITQGIIRSCPPAFTRTKILTSTVTRHQNTTSDGDAVSSGGELPGHMLGFFLLSETWGERERIMREEFQRLHHPHIVQHSSSSCQLLCTHTSHFLPCHGLWHSNSRLNGLRHHHWA